MTYAAVLLSSLTLTLTLILTYDSMFLCVCKKVALFWSKDMNAYILSHVKSSSLATHKKNVRLVVSSSGWEVKVSP